MMRSSSTRTFVASSAVFLLACLPSMAQLVPLLERHAGSSPDLSKPSSATPGGVVYEEFDYPVWFTAIPAEDMPDKWRSNTFTIRANVPLRGFLAVRSGAWVFCGEKQPYGIPVLWALSLPPGARICPADLDKDGKYYLRSAPAPKGSWYPQLQCQVRRAEPP